MNSSNRFGVWMAILVSCWLSAATTRAIAQDNQPASAETGPPEKKPDDSTKNGPVDSDKEKPKGKPYDIRTTKWLTGDWGGQRTEWEEQGLRFKIRVMNQIMANLHGGKETKNGHDTAGSYEFNVHLDLEKMGLIEGAEFWIRGKGTWGGDISDFDREKVGGLFKTNQDASIEEAIFVDKWHYRQFLFDKKLEFRIGRMEPVKDLFDTSKIIGHEDKYFMNRALVINPTIPLRKGLGLFVRWNFSEHAYLSAAALDANSRPRQTNFNTAFHDKAEFRFYAELGCKPAFKSAKGDLPGHYRAGTWYDPLDKTQFFDTLDGRRAERFKGDDWGFYIGLDQMIWKENEDPNDKQGLSVAARYGYADGEVNLIEHFWAIAAQYEGLFAERDKDVIGLGIAQGVLSDAYREIHRQADRETVYELYYSYRATPWLTISPDLQFITNAGGDDDDNDVFVAGLRFRMFL